LRRIEGFISKKNVLRWLKHYHAIQVGDRIDDGVPINTGPKAYDGVSGGRLNKFMLGKALDDMRQAQPFYYRCASCRWIKPVTRREALQLLGVSALEYARGCDEAVEYVYRHVNGGAVGYSKLLAGYLAVCSKAIKKSLLLTLPDYG
jgi:hypothetical protein